MYLEFLSFIIKTKEATRSQSRVAYIFAYVWTFPGTRKAEQVFDELYPRMALFNFYLNTAIVFSFTEYKVL